MNVTETRYCMKEGSRIILFDDSQQKGINDNGEINA
jgi:hypothetical protein